MSVIINGTGGGGGTPANPSGSVQYNNAGSFGGFGIYTAATHTLELDAADSATPNAQTIEVQSVLAGTLNTNGQTWTMQGSLSTGGFTPGNISFNTGFNGIKNAGPLTCTFNFPTDSDVTANNNGFPPNQPIYFTTTGTLPTPLSPLTTYYVDPFTWNALEPNRFQISATNGGSTIAIGSAGSGTHTVTAGGVVTISIASPAVITLNFHCLVPGQTITFQTTGALPTGISAGVTYFVIYGSLFPPAGLTPNTFQISTTLNGPPVNTSGSQSGTHTIQIQGGTVQNPAEPAVIVGPPASTLSGSAFNPTFNGVNALTVNMVDASSALLPPSALLLNAWNIGPYQTNLFTFFDVPNAVDRYFMTYQSHVNYFVGIAGLSGESTRTGIFLSTDNDARLTFGLNASDVPGFSLGNGSLGADTFLARAAPAVWEFGVTFGDAQGWFNYGGQARLDQDFSVTNSTVLVNVTGNTRNLSVNVLAGRSYSFDVYLTCSDAAAGGVQAAIGGSCTATALIYDGWVVDSNAIKGQGNSTALGGAVASTVTAATTGIVIQIKGLITVNTAGTLTVQFAQNSSNGSASIVRRGSYFIVQDVR